MKYAIAGLLVSIIGTFSALILLQNTNSLFAFLLFGISFILSFYGVIRITVITMNKE